jgi:hypothetical protein
MKTKELTGAALDWAVAKCELQNGANYTLDVNIDIDGTLRVNFGGMYPEWSTDWHEGGAIIEREGITILSTESGEWCAAIGELYYEDDEPRSPTPLIAAMRCYVASKMGDDVEVPEELQGETA